MESIEFELDVDKVILDEMNLASDNESFGHHQTILSDQHAGTTFGLSTTDHAKDSDNKKRRKNHKDEIMSSSSSLPSLSGKNNGRRGEEDLQQQSVGSDSGPRVVTLDVDSLSEEAAGEKEDRKNSISSKNDKLKEHHEDTFDEEEDDVRDGEVLTEGDDVIQLEPYDESVESEQLDEGGNHHEEDGMNQTSVDEEEEERTLENDESQEEQDGDDADRDGDLMPTDAEMTDDPFDEFILDGRNTDTHLRRQKEKSQTATKESHDVDDRLKVATKAPLLASHQKDWEEDADADEDKSQQLTLDLTSEEGEVDRRGLSKKVPPTHHHPLKELKFSEFNQEVYHVNLGMEIMTQQMMKRRTQKEDREDGDDDKNNQLEDKRRSNQDDNRINPKEGQNAYEDDDHDDHPSSPILSHQERMNRMDPPDDSSNDERDDSLGNKKKKNENLSIKLQKEEAKEGEIIIAGSRTANSNSSDSELPDLGWDDYDNKKKKDPKRREIRGAGINHPDDSSSSSSSDYFKLHQESQKEETTIKTNSKKFQEDYLNNFILMNSSRWMEDDGDHLDANDVITKDKRIRREVESSSDQGKKGANGKKDSSSSAGVGTDRIEFTKGKLNSDDDDEGSLNGSDGDLHQQQQEIREGITKRIEFGDDDDLNEKENHDGDEQEAQEDVKMTKIGASAIIKSSPEDKNGMKGESSRMQMMSSTSIVGSSQKLILTMQDSEDGGSSHLRIQRQDASSRELKKMNALTSSSSASGWGGGGVGSVKKEDPPENDLPESGKGISISGRTKEDAHEDEEEESGSFSQKRQNRLSRNVMQEVSGETGDQTDDKSSSSLNHSFRGKKYLTFAHIFDAALFSLVENCCNFFRRRNGTKSLRKCAVLYLMHRIDIFLYQLIHKLSPRPGVNKGHR